MSPELDGMLVAILKGMAFGFVVLALAGFVYSLVAFLRWLREGGFRF